MQDYMIAYSKMHFKLGIGKQSFAYRQTMDSYVFFPFAVVN